MAKERAVFMRTHAANIGPHVCGHGTTLNLRGYKYDVKLLWIHNNVVVKGAGH